jgi:CRP/FNR family cyclic AMP-dependent transcriptional regulator
VSVTEELRRIPGLSELPEAELAVLALVLKRREVVAGARVIEQGKPSQSCFFLVRGEVEVSKTIAGTPRVLNTLTEGATFGQIGLADGGPRTASVVTTSPAVVLELTRTDYDRLLASGRLAALRVQEEVARAAIRQLRTATHRLGLLQKAKNPAGPALQNVREGLSNWDIDLDKVEVIKDTSSPRTRYGR